MILMRTLRKDYARYSKEDELDDLVSVFVPLSPLATVGCIRREIWEMSMAGNRCMETSSDLQNTPFFLPVWLAQVTNWPLWLWAVF